MLCAGLGLSACLGTSEPQPTAAALRFDAGGAAVEGISGRTGLRIDFGRAQTGVIDTVSRLKATRPVASFGPDLCGPGSSTVRYPDRLWLVFTEGTFTGWMRPDPSGTGILQAGQSCEMPVL